MSSARIVIIGGGVIGLGIAYHLAKLGVDDVILLERNQLGSGTSWHAAGIVGPLRSSINLTRLAAYASELFPTLEHDTGQSSGYKQTGGYWLARSAQRMYELQRIAAMGDITGIGAEIIGPDELAARAPFLQTSDLVGALWVAQDGQANPVDICMAYAKGARTAGIEIREGVSCCAIKSHNNTVHSVQLSTGECIRCEKIVNCAGVWAREVGALAGVPVPLQAVEHMYIVSEPVAELPDPLPIIRDLDGGIYLKSDTTKIVLGGFENNAKIWHTQSVDDQQAFLQLDEDWAHFEPFMIAGLQRLPVLGKIGIQHFMNGPESFTPDSKPLLGESPFMRGFFVAAGMNSVGMMSSAGVGKIMAQWLLDDAAPLDLWEVDIARFDRASASKAFLVKRMQEAVGDVFAMHWPYKQMNAARGLRRSPLQQELSAAGAVFGTLSGWQRALWYAIDKTEQQIHYSFNAQSWWPAAAREAIALQNHVVLYELSPFSKIDVIGPDALLLLQQLSANNIDVEPGTVVYTQWLNQRGGIEADVTITRRGEQDFRVVSGAASRYKDLAWATRQRDRLALNTAVIDMTSSEVVLGLMGPQSRALLQSLTDTDCSAKAFSYASSQLIDLDMAVIRASRVSFVGELGWELYIPVEYAACVYQALIDAGQSFGLTHAGHLSLDACRLEKGFKHWGHDIGPQNTPLEAGLSFAVAWHKTGGFIGHDALLEQKQNGFAKRLLQFHLNDKELLLLHDEPIYSAGKLLGYTTSGGRGFRSDLNLCFAYINCQPGTSKNELLQKDYEIAINGQRFELCPLQYIPYDPSGTRMRG